MEGVGLSKKAKTDHKSQEKSTTGEKNGQNTKMEALDGRTRELQSSVDGRRARWENLVAEKGHSRATHEPTREGQLPKKDMHMTTRRSLVIEVIASGG